MCPDQSAKTGPDTLLSAWMESATAFWQFWTKMGPEAAGIFETVASTAAGPKWGTPEAWPSALKMGQGLFSALSKTETLEAAMKGTTALPEIFFKLAQTWGDGYFLLYRQWQEKLGELGEHTKPYQFKSLDRDTFKAWVEIYEKDFRQILNLPQLGLTRISQERLSLMADRFIRFQGAMADFLYLLYLPFEKSLRAMPEKLEEMMGEGKLSENFNYYYKIWLQMLEGHYMTLLQSPEYIDNLSQTLNALENFTVAKQELLIDALRTLPIPTNKDMDELYKEIYRLKKQVQELTSKVDRLNSLP